MIEKLHLSRSGLPTFPRHEETSGCTKTWLGAELGASCYGASPPSFDEYRYIGLHASLSMLGTGLKAQRCDDKSVLYGVIPGDQIFSDTDRTKSLTSARFPTLRLF